MDQIGVAHCCRVDRDLVGARLQESPDVVQAADPPTHGQRHETDLGRPPDHVPEDLALFVTGGDVEKNQLIGSLGVVPTRNLHRIAGVTEVQEVRSLDHPAMVDIKARDDPLGQHALPHRGTPAGNTPPGAPESMFVTEGYAPILERTPNVFYKTREIDPRG